MALGNGVFAPVAMNRVHLDRTVALMQQNALKSDSFRPDCVALS